MGRCEAKASRTSVEVRPSRVFAGARVGEYLIGGWIGTCGRRASIPLLMEKEDAGNSFECFCVVVYQMWMYIGQVQSLEEVKLSDFRNAAGR